MTHARQPKRLFPKLPTLSFCNSRIPRALQQHIPAQMMIGAENGCLVYSTTGNLHPLHLFSRVLLNFHFCKLPEVQQSPPVVTLPLPPPSPACSHCCLGFQGFVIPSRRPL
ncbi:hypothetical protein CDAR_297421 [Caerostris darwini]|uniref:Uncharacterized protein n=1 Tax=Caerostris darwini TaxID=1538125 RepID=A0AAV4TYE5_9ARAC|nr:hypothetical protein CDAR_297421 [Caerostris darwini]